MEYCEDIIGRGDWFRGNEIASKPIDAPERTDNPTVTSVHVPIDANGGERDTASEEREAKLELWMEEIKAFIRKIDVSSL